MRISFDGSKRRKTLEERKLDFADALRVFDGFTLTQRDGRKDYGEVRQITVGVLFDGVVVLVWTNRGDERRIISMRKASKDERERYYDELERSR